MLRPLQKFMFMFGEYTGFIDLQPVFSLQLQHILRIHFRVCRHILYMYNKNKMDKSERYGHYTL